MHLSVQLWGSEVGHERADDPALVKWMNQIRLKVQERVGSDLMPGRWREGDATQLHPNLLNKKI
jgi:hypothetical protein